MAGESTTQTSSETAPAELEAAACPNGCAGEAEQMLHEFGRFRVCRCAHCGLVRLNPRLAEAQLSALYEREYFSGDHGTGYDTYERDQALYEKTFARRLKLIKKFKSAGRLLDIGCGLGYFMNVAARMGFTAHGLDYSAYAVQRAGARFPGRVHCGALTDGLFPARFFDVVTMFDLFEHVYQPRAFLQTLHAITKDDGVVVITTPNQQSLLARLSGRRWVSYKIPEHVYYYTPATLTRMVAPHFEVELIRAEGQYCTLEFLSERIRQLNAPVGRGLLRVARTCGAKDLSVYVNSGSMTAVLRKRI